MQLDGPELRIGCCRQLEIRSEILLESGQEMLSCATMFRQQLLGLLYVVFLIFVVVILAFK